ncbi:MAG: hypothetical protein ACI8ZM_001789 [Crocinitomix sp.]|jgi:hypothetical protein
MKTSISQILLFIITGCTSDIPNSKNEDTLITLDTLENIQEPMFTVNQVFQPEIQSFILDPRKDTAITIGNKWQVPNNIG